MRHRTFILVAKGKSAENARNAITRIETNLPVGQSLMVGTLSEAGRLIPGRVIDYCFFTHCAQAINIRDMSDYYLVKHFVTSAHGELLSKSRQVLSQSDAPVLTYQQKPCGGSTNELEHRLLSGHICHHHTTTGAMHWISKYLPVKRLYVIGVDGGRDYANGVYAVDQPAHTALTKSFGTEDYLTIWQGVAHRLAELLGRVYGVQTTFLKE